MQTIVLVFTTMSLTIAAPQYRPIAPIAPLVPRTSLNSLSPLTARTPLSSLAPVSTVTPIGSPIVPPLVVKPTSPLKVTAGRDDPSTAVILRYENDSNGIDSYSYAVETSDGQFKEEQGQLINPGIPDAESIAVRGQYSFIAPDGVLYSVAYVADENGFQPHAEQGTIARAI